MKLLFHSQTSIVQVILAHTLLYYINQQFVSICTVVQPNHKLRSMYYSIWPHNHHRTMLDYPFSIWMASGLDTMVSICHQGTEITLSNNFSEYTQYCSWITYYVLCNILYGHTITIELCRQPILNSKPTSQIHHINGLVQERCNSIVNSLQLCLSCTNPSI